MQRKKRILILLLLIIGICAVSTASAADDVDVLSADDANLEETSTELEEIEENIQFKPINGMGEYIGQNGILIDDSQN